MEEDVEPKDVDGVDGRGVSGSDGWVGGLGEVGVSSIFGLVRRTGTFDVVLPTFVLVSRIHLTQQYRGNDHFFITVSSSRRETMVDGSLTRVSALCVGLGVGGSVVVSGSRDRPTHSCDGWVCDLGEVGVSSIYGWVRGFGTFVEVLPTFMVGDVSCDHSSYSWISHLLTSSLSLGISSLFCRTTQCM
jgi:hypothetical protein